MIYGIVRKICKSNFRFGGFEFGIHNMSRFANLTGQFANDESSTYFRNFLSKTNILSASSEPKAITNRLTNNNVKVRLGIIIQKNNKIY